MLTWKTKSFLEGYGHDRGVFRESPQLLGEFRNRIWSPRASRRHSSRLLRRIFGRRFVTTSGVVYGTYTALTVTNLQSLAIDTTDPYAGWQSARISNLVTLADDYEIVVDLSTAATAPANDSAVYVYVVPWMSTDGGTTWITGGNFGTTTLPTGTEGTASMSDPNSMKGPVALPYKITSQRIEGQFTIAQVCGFMPDGWSLAIRNNCGAALGTGCVVSYRTISETFT